MYDCELRLEGSYPCLGPSIRPVTTMYFLEYPRNITLENSSRNFRNKRQTQSFSEAVRYYWKCWWCRWKRFANSVYRRLVRRISCKINTAREYLYVDKYRKIWAQCYSLFCQCLYKYFSTCDFFVVAWCLHLNNHGKNHCWNFLIWLDNLCSRVRWNYKSFICLTCLKLVESKEFLNCKRFCNIL